MPSQGWERFRDALRRRATRLRLDSRVQARFDESDLVQETLIRALEAERKGTAPAGLSDEQALCWLGELQGNALIDVLRNVFAQKRDPRRQLDLQLVQQALHDSAFAGVLHVPAPSAPPDLKAVQREEGRLAGEVLILDWGLSKVVLAEEGDDQPIQTSRSRDHEMSTQAGARIGTLAYAPPEQATGDKGAIAAHSDVFGLGAILCEILTGKPPYCVGDVKQEAGEPDESALAGELVRRIEAGDVTAAHARLGGCGAAAELVTLTRRCLARDPAQRPDAFGVAGAVSEYLDALQALVQKQQVEQATLRSRLSAFRWRALAGGLLSVSRTVRPGGAKTNCDGSPRGRRLTGVTGTLAPGCARRARRWNRTTSSARKPPCAG